MPRKLKVATTKFSLYQFTAGYSTALPPTCAMKLILSTHNVTLTKAIEDHILAKIDKLEHFDRWTIDARVTIEHDDTRDPAQAFGCSMRVGVRGPDLFAEDHEADLYAAIDAVAKKIEQQIRKRHNKTKAKKHTDAARSKERRRST